MSWRGESSQQGEYYYQQGPGKRRLLIAGTLLFVAVLALVAIVVVVRHGVRRPTTHIGDILNSPDEFKDKDVTIDGVAVEVFTPPLVHVAFVYVDDGTGRIWCRLSGDGKEIKVGARICVEGKVTEIVDIPLLPKKSLRIIAIGGKRCQEKDHVPRPHLPLHWPRFR